MRKVAIGGLLLAVAAPATAATIFDSQVLGEPLCSDSAYICVTNRRDAYYNFAAVLSFAEDTSIAQIGAYSAVGDAQTIQFVIFNSGYDVMAGPGPAGTLAFSQTKFFTPRGLGFIYSDPMSFTFKAGRTYDIGVIGDGHSLTGRYVAAIQPDINSIQLTTGAITEFAANANIGYYAYDPAMPATTGFAHPFTGGYTNSAAWIQLNTDGMQGTGDVPEPAAWVLLVAGFGLIGGALRRRVALA